ncbi:hypothetical protein QBC46DRAFT_450826 [Diplogelasinospora grovesii]|uniref:STB6-like N-terminal domain-containing protein n=1 Tax=Diplogelasinospora grovesii TaxID=303347 RepID=A0AAN6N4A8_9PEZI|nr:hypothetical protein QBC46DRAFT_450826 [Diplogelasinospora grovesii]
MSLRLPFPGALDGRVHREEDLTLARINSHRNAPKSSALEPPMPMSAGPTLDGATAHAAAAMEASRVTAPVAPGRRRIVFPDPIAFRFLEDDPSVTVIERRNVLQGYELYLVEQWVCSRQSPTLVIVTYTGDPKHSIVVGVLEVPTDEKGWSPRLKLYFTAVQQYHARPKETDIGEIMVTNLSSFPSALTVIAVPDGDIRNHRQEFIVNEDLKRLGCSGRSGMTLSEPTPATQAKFLQLYKTSDRIPISQAVLELVKLCQVALFIFGKLDQEYMDGLLCDVTETAINNWWTEIGSEYFNIEPTDGILGPTTVAALLGTLIGARNRLSYLGAPIAKDVFDIDSTKRGIGAFQKTYKLEKTRRLDRRTLLKLHSATAKAAAGEGGWGVQKAVKSTVAEIGGKRGELVIGMVSGRDKANIGDVETLDLDKFINLVHGERSKWLWHGKPRKTFLDQNDAPLFGNELKDDTISQTSSRRTQSMPVEDESEARKKEDSPGVYSAQPQGSALSMADSPGDKDALRRTVFKSVAGKVSDARSGLGRIRDAVGGGLRGHASRPSRDEGPDSATGGFVTPSVATLAQSSASLSSPVAVGRAFTWKNKPEEYLNAMKKQAGESPAPPRQPAIVKDTIAEEHETPLADVKETTDPFEDGEYTQSKLAGERDKLEEVQATEIRKELVDNDVSVGGSVVDESDLQGPILAAERRSNIPLACLQRRHSMDTVSNTALHQPANEARYPRRLSFSDAEDAILRWEEILDIGGVTPVDCLLDSFGSITTLQTQAELARSLYGRLLGMQMDLAPWVTAKVSDVEALDETLGVQQADLQSLYLAAGDAYQHMHHSSSELVAEERLRLTEGVKDVETLMAKLEYEINALVGKVQDVEDGVAQFERQVVDVEKRAEELKAVLETESWLHWFVRTLTGIGTGPNITRGVVSERPQGRRT